MTTKTFEGEEWILKSSVETIIKDRVSKVAARASTAESRIQELNSKISDMSKSVSNVDILTSKIEELQTQLSTSNQKFQHYKSISKHGLNDPEMIEDIEYFYKKSQSKLPKKDQQNLSDWLDTQVSNPSAAPKLLRPHLESLQSKQPATEQPAAESSMMPSTIPSAPSAPSAAPAVNRGAIPSPESQDFLSRAASDPDFYRENRSQIMKIWNERNRR